MTEDLLAPLRDADVRPPRIDLRRAVREGRRRRRIRHAAVAGLAAAAVLATTVAVGAMTGRTQAMPADRRPAPLPTSTVAPPLGSCELGRDTAPYADRHPWVVFDDTWQVAAHLVASGTAPVEAVRYVDGREERIPDVPGDFELTGVNRAGDLAGVSLSRQRAWVYRDGTFTRLTLPAGMTDIVLQDINEAGDVLGTVTSAGGDRRAAVVWPGGRPGLPRLLHTADGRSSRATGIAWDGTVVGETFAGDDVTPYLWRPDGTGEPLPVPSELRFAGVSNLAGDWATGPNVRWNIRTGRVDVLRGVDPPMIVDVYGRVYGVSGDEERRQVVWANGTIEPLPEWFNGRKVQLRAVRADGRQLLGVSSGGDGWIRWTC